MITYLKNATRTYCWMMNKERSCFQTRIILWSSLVLEQARNLAREGYTVIQTTHHPEQSYMFSDRILTIQKGRVLAEGKPEEVLTEQTIHILYGVDVDVVSLYDDKARICIPTHIAK